MYAFYQIYKKALKKGVLLRPLGDVIYFNPPLIIEKEDMDLINNAINLPLDSSYTITMGTLYYSKDRAKILKTIKDKISSKMKSSFSKVSSIIDEQFK